MADITAFFVRRWHGEVPLRRVLWRDMFVVGTGVNVLATFAALLAFGHGAPTWVAAVVHFSPLPYNLFLFAAVGRAPAPGRLAVVLSFAWLAAMTVA